MNSEKFPEQLILLKTNLDKERPGKHINFLTILPSLYVSLDPLPYPCLLRLAFLLLRRFGGHQGGHLKHKGLKGPLHRLGLDVEVAHVPAQQQLRLANRAPRLAHGQAGGSFLYRRRKISVKTYSASNYSLYKKISTKGRTTLPSR